MKKVFMTLLVASLAVATVNAQEIPQRKREAFKPVERERMYGKKELSSLNLTDEQKTKMKQLNEEFRKQSEELNKQDNITVKESREKKEALRKDHQQKFQAILTPEQKSQLEKDQAARSQRGTKRGEKMKEKLNLTDEQSAKISANRAEMMEKVKGIRSNTALTQDQKDEQVKELMKKHRETTMSLLTDEQKAKMKEGKRKHGPRKTV